MLLTDTDTQYFFLKSGMQRVKWSITKMLQNILCTNSNISWKSHENPFILFFRNVDRQTDKPTGKGENITIAVLWRYKKSAHCFLCMDRQFKMESDNVIVNTFQGYFTITGTVMGLPQWHA